MVNAKSIQFPLFILEAFSVQQALNEKAQRTTLRSCPFFMRGGRLISISAAKRPEGRFARRVPQFS